MSGPASRLPAYSVPLWQATRSCGMIWSWLPPALQGIQPIQENVGVILDQPWKMPRRISGSGQRKPVWSANEVEPCFEAAHVDPEDDIPLIRIAKAHEATRCESMIQAFAVVEAVRKFKPSSSLIDLQVKGARVQHAKGAAHENPFLATEAAHVMPGQLCCGDTTFQDYFFRPKSLTHLAVSGQFAATTVANCSLNRVDSIRERSGLCRDFENLSKLVLSEGGVSSSDAFYEFQAASVKQIPICQGKVQQQMLQVMNRCKASMSENEQWGIAQKLAELIIMEEQLSVVRVFQPPTIDLASYYESLIEADLTPL